LGAWWLDRHPESPLRSEWVYYKDQVQHDFSAFPTATKDLKILDPSCGSGHFLVEAFHMLLAMRQEEGESRDKAINGIVRDNLHGLEIDPRCIQIAGFAVAIEAWKAGFPTDQYLPLPKLACVGLPIRAEKTEWLKLAAGDGLLEGELEKYYDLFKNADSLGSLIQIEEGSTLVPGEVLMQKLESALAKEKAIGDPVAEAFGETASGVLKAVQYLRRRDFHIVVTNPPFLGRGKQSDVLQQYCEREYNKSKKSTATCFIERCKLFLIKGGLYSLVTPQNWLFLKSDKPLRVELLRLQSWKIIVKLGIKAFETPMYDFNIALIILGNQIGNPDAEIITLDASSGMNPISKSVCLIDSNFMALKQKDQYLNPDSRIIFSKKSGHELLSEYADSFVGLQNGDSPRYILYFWEIQRTTLIWEYFQLTADETKPFTGRLGILRWEGGEGSLVSCPNARVQGVQGWGKKGVAIRLMGKLPSTLYHGNLYDQNSAVIIPKDDEYLPLLWCYCSSKNFFDEVKKVDQSLKIAPATLVKVPFDLSYWRKVAEEKYPNGLPEPHSNAPTQWLFKGNIVGSDQPLHVAIARMLGYRWPEQPVEEDPIDAFADRDGIVCIPPVWGERPAVELLRNILAAAYGSEWSPRKEEELLKQSGYTKSGGLEAFLRDEFFASHSKLFHHRPFIWQVWDGTKDGFSVLLNYHKLDRKTLEKLIYTYLGAWVTQQKDEVRQEKPGAEKRLAAAEALKVKLEQIL
ncbi:MAG: Uncharacterized protein XE11_2753, partial [Methanomicrobiales archaeon 53_19]